MSAVQDSAVEAVARAISTKTYATGCGDNSDCQDYDDMPERTADVYRAAARAAIAAMPTDTTLREQRDELLEALVRLVGEELGGDSHDNWRAHDSYSAWITWHDRKFARAAITKAKARS